jgi:hypothetical protein
MLSVESPRLSSPSRRDRRRGSFTETTSISRNTPFKVSCDPVLGGRVDFGYGENSVSVPIYGYLQENDAESAPPLQVSKWSEAAAGLSQTLCERISESILRALNP